MHISINRFIGCFNTVSDQFGIKYALHKTKDVSSKLFDVIKGINESKARSKNISYECRCELEWQKM